MRRAGDKARRHAGFALGVELRSWRLRAGVRHVADVAATLGVSRSLIDGIELGDYDDRAHRHLAFWTRKLLIRLGTHYGRDPVSVSAILRLAQSANALHADESALPIYREEWLAEGGQTWTERVAEPSEAQTDEAVGQILKRHAMAWSDLQAKRVRHGVPTELEEIGIARARGTTQISLRSITGLSPDAQDVLGFVAFASVGRVPGRLLEFAGVAGGHIERALLELASLALVSLTEEQDDVVVDVPDGARRAVLSTPSRMHSRWQDGEWARRCGLRYLPVAIYDKARGRNVLPLGDLENYANWLERTAAAGEIRDALLAWTRLSRYLWDSGKRALWARVERIGAACLSALEVRAPDGGRLLRALYLAENSYAEADRGRLSQALDLGKASLAIFMQLHDVAGESHAHMRIGRVQYLLRNYDEARRDLSAALDCIRRLELERLDALPLTAIAQLKEFELFAPLVVGHRGYVLDTAMSRAEIDNLLASVEMKAGNFDCAIERASSSVRRYRRARWRRPGSEAVPLLNRARSYAGRAAAGDIRRARRDLRAGIDIAERSNRPDLKSGILIRLAELEKRQGRDADAEAALRSADALQASIENPGDASRIARLRHEWDVDIR